MEVGTIFTEEQYAEAYAYVTENKGCKIVEIAPVDGVRQFQIELIPVPTVEEQNAQIKQTRAGLYSLLIDPLHAERQRKTVLGTWTETDEAEYVAEVKRQTLIIQTDNPYIE